MSQKIVATNKIPGKQVEDAVPFLSSWQQNWNGILVEQHQLPPGEHIVPPLSEHRLLLSLGHPLHIIQKRDGKKDERLLVPGDMIVAPAQQPSTCIWDEPLTILLICLQQTYLEQVAIQIEHSSSIQIEILNQFGVRDSQLEQIVLQLRAELLSHEPGKQLYVESLTNMLTIHLLRYYAGNTITHLLEDIPLSKRAFQHVLEYIHEHLQDDLSLDKLARIAQLSPFHFSRSFKQATGLTPHQYIVRQRLEQAKHLLLTTDTSIAEVAADAGFYDQGHLARHMRRYLGVTPKDIQDSKIIR